MNFKDSECLMCASGMHNQCKKGSHRNHECQCNTHKKYRKLKRTYCILCGKGKLECYCGGQQRPWEED